jgi:hypothetical protein
VSNTPSPASWNPRNLPRATTPTPVVTASNTYWACSPGSPRCRPRQPPWPHLSSSRARPQPGEKILTDLDLAILQIAPCLSYYSNPRSFCPVSSNRPVSVSLARSSVAVAGFPLGEKSSSPFLFFRKIPEYVYILLKPYLLICNSK